MVMVLTYKNCNILEILCAYINKLKNWICTRTCPAHIKSKIDITTTNSLLVYAINFLKKFIKISIYLIYYVTYLFIKISFVLALHSKIDNNFNFVRFHMKTI